MQIGPYKVERELGRGGMGAVYLCRDAQGAPLAVKILHAGLVLDEGLAKRFEREGQALEVVNHPNVIGLRRRGRSPRGRLWLAMEFVKGESLLQRLKRGGPLSSEAARAIMIPICAGLQHAHECGVLHRDLKPGNVLLRAPDDLPVVVDFGLALPRDASQHLTRTGDVLGSPGYLSPEQCGSGGGSTPATDVYGLGALLYAMLTGQPPLRGTSLIHTLDLVLNRRPTAPNLLVASVEPALAALCLRCLEKDPDDRFQTPADLETALRALRAEGDGRAGRGRLGVVAGVAAAAAALGLVGAGVSLLAQRPSAAASPSAAPSSTGALGRPAKSEPPLPPLPPVRALQLGEGRLVPWGLPEDSPLNAVVRDLRAGRLDAAWAALERFDVEEVTTRSERLTSESLFLRGLLFEASGSSAARAVYENAARDARFPLTQRWYLLWRRCRLETRAGDAFRDALDSLDSSPPMEGISDFHERAYDLERLRLLILQSADKAAHAAVWSRRAFDWGESATPASLRGPLRVARAASQALGVVRGERRLLEDLEDAEREGLDEAWSRAMEWVRARHAPIPALSQRLKRTLASGGALRVIDLCDALVAGRALATGARRAGLAALVERSEEWLREHARECVDREVERGRVNAALKIVRLVGGGGKKEAYRVARLALIALSRAPLPALRLKIADLAEAWRARSRDSLAETDLRARALLACFDVLALTASPNAAAPDLALRLIELDDRIQEGLRLEPSWDVLHEGLVRCRLAQGVVVTTRTLRQSMRARRRKAAEAWCAEADARGLGRLAQQLLQPLSRGEPELLALGEGRGNTPLALWSLGEAIKRDRVLEAPALLRLWGSWVRRPGLTNAERRASLARLGNGVLHRRDVSLGYVVNRWLDAWTFEDKGSALAVARFQAGLLAGLEREKVQGVLRAALDAPRTPWTNLDRAAVTLSRAMGLASQGQFGLARVQLHASYALSGLIESFRAWAEACEATELPRARSAAAGAYVRYLGVAGWRQAQAFAVKKLRALEIDPRLTWKTVSRFLESHGNPLSRVTLAEELFPAASAAPALADACGQVIAELQRTRRSSRVVKDAKVVKEAKAEAEQRLTSRERELLEAQASLLATRRGVLDGKAAPNDLETALAQFMSVCAGLSQETRDAWRFPLDIADTQLHLEALGRKRGPQEATPLSRLSAWIERRTAPYSVGEKVVRLLEAKGDFEEAVRVHTLRAASPEPGLPELRLELCTTSGRLSAARGEPAAALKAFDQALREGLGGYDGQTLKLAIQRGRVLVTLKRGEEAAEGFERARCLGRELRGEDHLVALLAQGRGLADLGRIREAQGALDAARELAATRPLPQRARARVEAVQARVWRAEKAFAKAEAAARRALAGLAEDDQAARSLATEDLALSLAGLGDLEQARRTLEALLKAEHLTPAKRGELEAQLKDLR